MAGERSDESLLTSLRELRAIEDQRLADEHAAREAAVHARRRAREAAEQAARDAQARELQDQRDAARAAEHARDTAERTERLRLEAAQAAERARHQIELDHRRLIEDVALRREVALRQRPRWMIAITALAVGAAIALGGFATVRSHDAAQAHHALDRARAARSDAERVAAKAQNDVNGLRRDLEAQRRCSNSAAEERRLEELAAVRTVAQQDIAREHTRRRRAELDAQEHRRLEERRRRERVHPVRVSDDCLRNALCK